MSGCNSRDGAAGPVCRALAGCTMLKNIAAINTTVSKFCRCFLNMMLSDAFRVTQLFSFLYWFVIFVTEKMTRHPSMQLILQYHNFVHKIINYILEEKY
jgi:hypothetical protein